MTNVIIAGLTSWFAEQCKAVVRGSAYHREPTPLSRYIDAWGKRVEDEANQQHRRVKALDIKEGE